MTYRYQITVTSPVGYHIASNFHKGYFLREKRAIREIKTYELCGTCSVG